MDTWQEARFEHASRYFTTHANQRMALFQFALAFWAGIYAALGTAAQYDLTDFGRTATIVGVGATIVFWLLDRRTRELIKVAEEALREIESDIANETGAASIAVVSRGNAKRWWSLSYSQSFFLIYLTNISAILLAGSPALQQQIVGVWAWTVASIERLLS